MSSLCQSAILLLCPYDSMLSIVFYTLWMKASCPVLTPRFFFLAATYPRQGLILFSRIHLYQNPLFVVRSLNISRSDILPLTLFRSSAHVPSSLAMQLTPLFMESQTRSVIESYALSYISPSPFQVFRVRVNIHLESKSSTEHCTEEHIVLSEEEAIFHSSLALRSPDHPRHNQCRRGGRIA